MDERVCPQDSEGVDRRGFFVACFIFQPPCANKSILKHSGTIDATTQIGQTCVAAQKPSPQAGRWRRCEEMRSCFPSTLMLSIEKSYNHALKAFTAPQLSHTRTCAGSSAVHERPTCATASEQVKQNTNSANHIFPYPKFLQNNSLTRQ